MIDLKNLSSIPESPGVYLMKGMQGKIIYIGKAANLKKRVVSYFSKDASGEPRTERLVRKIEIIDFIITNNEIDALILEANLIKLHKPQFNVKFRDDKKYPFIKVTLKEKYPRIFQTRIINKDGSLYLGPYTDVKAVKRVIKMGRKIFPVRTCGKRIPKTDCLDYHIGLCSAPCISLISQDEYRRAVNNLIKFLNGKHAYLQQELEEQMKRNSDQLHFEKAQVIKDRLFALKKIQNKQKVVLPRKLDIDIIAIAQDKSDYCIVVDEVRDGMLIYQHHYFLKGMSNTEEAIETFLTGYYGEKQFIPQEIITDTLPNNKSMIEQWLMIRGKHPVKIIKNAKKEKHALLSMANKNADLLLKNFIAKKDEQKVSRSVLDLQKYLKLKIAPLRIEAFDVSNIMGEFAVGSSVLFVNGKPIKSGYLHYSIRAVKGINDVAMIKEVITRRLNRIIKLKQDIPDLFLVDGGEGQLKASLSVMKQLGFKFPVIGIAKKYENIYMQGRKVVCLPGDSPALKLLKAIRDESHRFAIQYYRKLHTKSLSSSILDNLRGIGSEKKKRLIKHFGSVKKLRTASIQEIQRVEGFGEKTALKLLEHLNTGKKRGRGDST